MKKSLWLALFLLLLCTLTFSACGMISHTHEFEDWTITKNASCVEEGIRARYCSCGEMQTQAIPVSEHQYDTGRITTVATCIQDGIKTFTCTVAKCGHSYTESYSLPTYTANELYNQSVKYVGEIVVYDKKGKELGLGTGFVISSDGKIATNYHVIDGAYSADITINGIKYPIVSALAYDAKIDLAVLKINASGLTPATICKLPVSVGSIVYAIGSSRGMTNTYSQGIITYSDRVVDGVSHVQHDASITHGNSGGPLINVYGEVIGINSWMISESQNLNFAVFVGELDKLVYGTALTMAQFYELHRTANDVLTEWLLENYNSYGEWHVDYEIEGEDFVYSVAYDTEDDYNFVDGSWLSDDGMELYVCVYLDGIDGVYDYYAYFSDGVDENNTCGTVNAKSYTVSTLLTCDSYDGDYWDKKELMDLYSLAVSKAMEWFAYCLENYINELSLEDFGFLSFVDSQVYAKYQEELAALTAKYNDEVSKLQKEIDRCYVEIAACRSAVANAVSQLASLSPTCPQWFLQQYLNNLQVYGNSWAATTAARNAWSQEYSIQKNQLNNVISANAASIEAYESDISVYNAQIDFLTQKHETDIVSLKAKYGVE